ncbi:MAG: hypothetical protein R3F19_06965 [Verrucomicrobiales bacterium]
MLNRELRKIHGSALSVLVSTTLAISGQSHVLADEAELRNEIELLKSRLLQLEARLSQPAVPASSGSEPAGKVPVASSNFGDIDAEFMGSGSGGGAAAWYERTSLGGYGEMHLNLGDKDEIDFHRWVLFVDHEFNERFRLVSELELEHSIAGDGQNGEFELEQAYIEATFDNGWSGKGGLFLMPIGILNETHEPNTFFGTERNPIEREIIPSTWWEGGLQVSKKTDQGLLWDAAFHSGLAVPSSGGNAFRIRSGRQKVSEADASEWAATTRVRYTGIPGFEVGGSAQYQSDITPGRGEKNVAVLGEAHIDIRKGGFGLRALGGYWDIGGASPVSMGLDSQWGFYIEPSYTFSIGESSRLGVFGRYNQLEVAAGDIEQWDTGVNFWPADNIVLKADYSRIESAGASAEDVINFGIGYQF